MGRSGKKAAFCYSLPGAPSNPYPTQRNTQSKEIICETCNGRVILRKDWHSHSNSKAHKKNGEPVKPPTAADNGDSSVTEAQPDPRACHNCGESGHRKSECTNPRKARPAGKCFNCQQEGHSKADCTNEYVPSCRNCDQGMCTNSIAPLRTNCFQLAISARIAPSPRTGAR